LAGKDWTFQAGDFVQVLVNPETGEGVLVFLIYCVLPPDASMCYPFPLKVANNTHVGQTSRDYYAPFNRKVYTGYRFGDSLQIGLAYST